MSQYHSWCLHRVYFPVKMPVLQPGLSSTLALVVIGVSSQKGLSVGLTVAIVPLHDFIVFLNLLLDMRQFALQVLAALLLLQESGILVWQRSERHWSVRSYAVCNRWSVVRNKKFLSLLFRFIWWITYCLFPPFSNRVETLTKKVIKTLSNVIYTIYLH